MKKVTGLLLALFTVLCLCLPVLAEGDLVVDLADLLTEEQEADLRDRAEAVRDAYQFEVVFVTVDSLEGKSAQSYADDYFDFNGYGYGADDDGMLLLVAMQEREYHISTHAFGLIAFTDYGLDQMEEAFVPYLSQGDYAGGFEVFLEYADTYLYEAQYNEPVDIYVDDFDSDVEPMGFAATVKYAFGHLPIFLVISAVIALVTVLIMKSQLKTIRSKASALDYNVGYLNLSVQQDTFLYSRTTKTRIDHDNHSSGGGGSRSHSSSSGRSHGGSGGKF